MMFSPRSSRRVLPGSLFLLTVIGCKAPPAASTTEEHPAPVKAVTAQLEKMGEWTELLGSTQPLPGRAAKVVARIDGYVISSLTPSWTSGIAEGRHVDADQVIVRLDDRIARA